LPNLWHILKILSIFSLLDWLLLLQGVGFFEKKPNRKTSRRFTAMNISRRLGTLIVFAVPAIIGGGIVYGIFKDYVPVFVYEALLILVAGGCVSR
jgi:hypothetical protein